MSDTPGRILLTGANGHLGQRLIRRLASAPGPVPVRAVVRSERAAGVLRALPDGVRPETRIVDYRDAAELQNAAEGCTVAVHLVGILKQTRGNRYVDAHERPAGALAHAADAAGLSRVIHTSILGADPDSSNACLASRGRADARLLAAKTPALILRVPMVLGPGDAAVQALRRQAGSGSTSLLRGGATLEQPIAAADVVAALAAGATRAGLGDRVLELAGPESLSHRALVLRAAGVLGTEVTFRTLPAALGLSFALVAELLMRDPPLTRAMLGVLEHDDAVDPGPAAAALGIELTPLDAALRAAFEEEGST